MTLTIPMPLPSAANLREDWPVRARRVKAQRTWVAAYLRGPPPEVVEVAPVGPAPAWPSDEPDDPELRRPLGVTFCNPEDLGIRRVS